MKTSIKYIFTAALVGTVGSALLYSNTASAFAYRFDDIKVLGVGAEDLLGLMTPEGPNFHVKIQGALFSSKSTGEVEERPSGTTYLNAGSWDMEIVRSWDTLGRWPIQRQVRSFHHIEPFQWDITVRNDCSYCPVPLDNITWDLDGEINFAVTGIDVMSFIDIRYIEQFSINLADYDGTVFNDTSLPNELFLDQFEQAFAYMTVVVDPGLLGPTKKSTTYLLDLNPIPVPEPASFGLVFTGLAGLLWRRKYWGRKG